MDEAFARSQMRFTQRAERNSALYMSNVKKHGEPWRKGRPTNGGLTFDQLHLNMPVRVCSLGSGSFLGIVREIRVDYILVTPNKNQTSNLVLSAEVCGLRPTEDGIYHHWCWLEPF